MDSKVYFTFALMISMFNIIEIKSYPVNGVLFRLIPVHRHRMADNVVILPVVALKNNTNRYDVKWDSLHDTPGGHSSSYRSSFSPTTTESTPFEPNYDYQNSDDNNKGYNYNKQDYDKGYNHNKDEKPLLMLPVLAFPKKERHPNYDSNRTSTQTPPPPMPSNTPYYERKRHQIDSNDDNNDNKKSKQYYWEND